MLGDLQTLSRLKNYFFKDPGNPIFVFGHQKSGTTAIARLLAHYAGLSYSHDMFYRYQWNDNHKLFTKELLISEIIKRAPNEFRKGVIKDPDLTFQIAEIAKAFPESQFVFVARNPFSNITSILSRLDIPGSAPRDYDVQADEDIPLQWKNVLCSEMLGLPKGGCIETLAHRWTSASEAYFANADRCVLLKYEDFLASKEQEIINLATALNVSRKKPIVQLLDKQFQPRGKKVIDYKSFFGAQNYDRIDQITAANAGKFGYSTLQSGTP